MTAPATQNPIAAAVLRSLGSTTPIAAPTTQASCRNVSDRANALERSVSTTSRWISASSAIFDSAFADRR